MYMKVVCLQTQDDAQGTLAARDELLANHGSRAISGRSAFLLTRCGSRPARLASSAITNRSAKFFGT